MEGRRRPAETERQRDEHPRPDDPRKPKPWPDALEDQVAGNLEDTIAEEEQRRPQPVGGFAEPTVADHLQLGIGDILPLDIGDKIQEAEERPEPTGVA